MLAAEVEAALWISSALHIMSSAEPFFEDLQQQCSCEAVWHVWPSLFDATKSHAWLHTFTMHHNSTTPFPHSFAPLGPSPSPHSAFPSTLPNQDSQCTCLLEAMRSVSHTHFSSLGYRSITFMSFTELSFAPCKSKINDVWGLGEQCLYIGETCYMYSRMTTAGQVCAGHTHAPRLEGKSSCPAGGTCPKGKAKAKDGLPLPECPSKPGCGVSHLWRGTHVEGTLEDMAMFVSLAMFQITLTSVVSLLG